MPDMDWTPVHDEFMRLIEENYTNEEWFCGLPTEEKAKVFIAICRDAFRAENYRRKHWSDLQTIEFWVKWLKQPHQEEK